MLRRSREYLCAWGGRNLLFVTDPEYAMLNVALVSAFLEDVPAFVERHATTRLDRPEMEALILRLHAAFQDWQSLDARQQRQTPIEIVRNALTGVVPDDALPVTSRDLGEGSWRMHVAWGICRAEVVAGVVPTPEESEASLGVFVLVVSTNLMDRTRIDDIVLDRGAQAIPVRNPAGLEETSQMFRPAVALVDLDHAAAHDMIRALVALGIRTIAYGPHVDDHALAAARALGAEDALARSVFFRRLPSLIPRVV